MKEQKFIISMTMPAGVTTKDMADLISRAVEVAIKMHTKKTYSKPTIKLHLPGINR